MIPWPKKIELGDASWLLTDAYRIEAPSLQALKPWQQIVRDLDSSLYGLKINTKYPDFGETRISLHLEPELQNQPPGYYRLSLKPREIELTSPTEEGLRYAVQSLRQILYIAAKCKGDLPSAEIEDWPSFAWRGMHLDVSRHFFDTGFVYRYLDWMASLKLNKFHWHLSDDQGWRLESRRFPLLTKTGAWRKEADGSRYGGFYTRRDVEMVVNYATLRGIEVVPEIDIPGHAQAILAAYPEFACFPREFETLNTWGISQDILCAGKDAVIDFLKELFSELAELFPGQYVHLGGDEAPKDRWKACPHCQERIAALGLKDEEELQSWLLGTLAEHLRGLGKTVIGWDEILDGKIGPEPVVMCWRGDGVDAARRAHDNGNRYVICPNDRLYFDWKFAPGDDQPGGFGVTTPEDVYSLDLDRFRFADPSLFLGGQANLWTERISDIFRAKLMFQERIYPLAELFWRDPREKNWADLAERRAILDDWI